MTMGPIIPRWQIFPQPERAHVHRVIHCGAPPSGQREGERGRVCRWVGGITTSKVLSTILFSFCLVVLPLCFICMEWKTENILSNIDSAVLTHDSLEHDFLSQQMLTPMVNYLKKH